MKIPSLMQALLINCCKIYLALEHKNLKLIYLYYMSNMAIMCRCVEISLLGCVEQNVRNASPSLCYGVSLGYGSNTWFGVNMLTMTRDGLSWFYPCSGIKGQNHNSLVNG